MVAIQSMIPHQKRSTFKWKWENYPKNRNNDEVHLELKVLLILVIGF
jgi:hypothetical protein